MSYPSWPPPDFRRGGGTGGSLRPENSAWGYDRILGALANLGHHISDQTVGNILRRHDIAPASKRSQTTTWREFIRRHMDVLAGAVTIRQGHGALRLPDRGVSLLCRVDG
jgi:hypothetical protein